MRTIVRALVLVLVVAFLAGAWQARHPGPARRPVAGRPFGTAPRARARPAVAATRLVGVRAARQDGYDQVVLTFHGGLPGWRVAYVPAVRRDGGDQVVPLRGQAFLAVVFDPAAAHDPRGAPTFPDRTITTTYPTLRQVRFAGDFEGQVAFGVGLGGRTGFRVTELTGPARVAVDLRT